MPKRALRQIVVEGDVAYVPLTRGKVAVVDAADLPLVSGRHWHAVERHKTFYAASNGQPDEHGRRPIHYMHRVILGLSDGLEGDHRDSDGLNNRRSNLRPATRAENSRNVRPQEGTSSGAKGVAKTRNGKWRAYISIDRKQVHLGVFERLDVATEVARQVYRSMHGDFVRLTQ